MRLLDLFCGRWGWSRAFAARGRECVGVDLNETPAPENCRYVQKNVLHITPEWIAEQGIDFICASSPCEEFSVWGMKHFHPNPKYPETGILLFNHTCALCEASGVPYVMENVRSAQSFVGLAKHHCGPFYLWGTGVPPLLNQGISKKDSFRAMLGNLYEKIKAADDEYKRKVRLQYQHGQEKKRVRGDLIGAGGNLFWSHSEARKLATAAAATIPPELSACVCDYAERLLEQVA